MILQLQDRPVRALLHACDTWKKACAFRSTFTTVFAPQCYSYLQHKLSEHRSRFFPNYMIHFGVTVNAELVPNDVALCDNSNEFYVYFY